MKYIALIPAYEPDEKLITLIDKLKDKMDIVLVNDGSNKTYNQVFNQVKNQVHYLSYQTNKGKGYALKTGLKYIKDNYDKYIVITIDADGQHTVSDAIKLCQYTKTHLDTLVLGKRNWDKDTPLRSRIGNHLTRLVFKLKTKQSIYDTQTGLRAFSYELIDYMLSINGKRYEYEMNVLLNLKTNHIKYHEIPIETIYFHNNQKSHFRVIKDSYRIYKNILFGNNKTNHKD